MSREHYIKYFLTKTITTMKKCLTLVVALMLMFTASHATIAPTPAWDAPLTMPTVKIKPLAPFNVYVTNYGAYQNGTPFSPDYGVEIQVTFNQSVPAPYYAVVEVMGKWGGNAGASWRQFTVYFNQGQWRKYEDFPMTMNEEVYVATAGLADYGPQ